jgi:hypothetical protein
MPVLASQDIIVEQILADSIEVGDYVEIRIASKILMYDLLYLKNHKIVKKERVIIKDIPETCTRLTETLTVTDGSVTLSKEPVLVISIKDYQNNDVTATHNSKVISEITDVSQVIVEYDYMEPAQLNFSNLAITSLGQQLFGGFMELLYTHAQQTVGFTGTVVWDTL